MFFKNWFYKNISFMCNYTDKILTHCDFFNVNLFLSINFHIFRVAIHALRDYFLLRVSVPIFYQTYFTFLLIFNLLNFYSFISLLGKFLWIYFYASNILWCNYKNLFSENMLIVVFKWICWNKFDFTGISLRHDAEFNILIQSYSSLWKILILT